MSPEYILRAVIVVWVGKGGGDTTVCEVGENDRQAGKTSMFEIGHVVSANNSQS